jgi:hypothetical protein
MAKNVFRKAGIPLDAALVIFGWIAFCIGNLARANHPILTLCLLVVARVLP